MPAQEQARKAVFAPSETGLVSKRAQIWARASSLVIFWGFRDHRPMADTVSAPQAGAVLVAGRKYSKTQPHLV